MEIHFNPNLKTSKVAVKKKKTKSSDFKNEVNKSSSSSMENVRESMSIEELNVSESVFSVQSLNSHDALRESVREHGSRILKELESLHQALLTGTLSRSVIEKLHSYSQNCLADQIDDPQLKNILNQIEVRAAVEYAKLQK